MKEMKGKQDYSKGGALGIWQGLGRFTFARDTEFKSESKSKSSFTII